MKKSLLLVASAAFLIASCGPSAEEKAAMDKARQDSIDMVMKAREDSAKAADEARMAMEKARQDSIAEAAKQDSIAKAEEEAAKKKGGAKPKSTEQKQKEETKKVTGGKG